MYRSSNFQKQMTKILKSNGDYGPERYNAIEPTFTRSLPARAAGLAAELFTYITVEIIDSSRPESLLGDFIDLLWQDYDEKADPLEPRDWDVLKDLIDENAHELDMDLVQYVMEQIVAHDRL